MNKKDIQKLVKTLETYCQDNGARFTQPRRVTLEVIAASDGPIGAYDIIEAMGEIVDKPKPTTVYRSIEFLQENGFIHKIESLSAFVVCHAGHAHRGSQFVVCNSCGTVKEVHLCHLPKDLEKKVEISGFKMDHWNAEIHGTCQQCQVSH